MFGYLLIIFAWKAFSNLAQKYHKPKTWIYGLTTSVFIIIFQIAMAYILNVLLNDFFSRNTNTLISSKSLLIEIIEIFIAVNILFGVYYLLEWKWKKETNVAKNEIEEIGKSQEN